MRRDGYFQATRHPWACLCFILPFVLAYEAGLILLRHAETVRNGADSWLRWALAHVGLVGLLWAPLVVVGLLLVWSVQRRGDRPRGVLGVCAGMTGESALFAAALWGLSQCLAPLLGHWGVLQNLGVLQSVAGAEVPRAAPTVAGLVPDPVLEQIISFIGAGIYEETLFRLILLVGLIMVLRLAGLPVLVTAIVAVAGSALAFAAAHHLGPYGEAFKPSVFAFRASAGVFFALLFQFRGFGITVGAHIGYDVLVGVLLPAGR